MIALNTRNVMQSGVEHISSCNRTQDLHPLVSYLDLTQVWSGGRSFGVPGYSFVVSRLAFGVLYLHANLRLAKAHATVYFGMLGFPRKNTPCHEPHTVSR